MSEPYTSVFNVKFVCVVHCAGKQLNVQNTKFNDVWNVDSMENEKEMRLTSTEQQEQRAETYHFTTIMLLIQHG